MNDQVGLSEMISSLEKKKLWFEKKMKKGKKMEIEFKKGIKQ